MVLGLFEDAVDSKSSIEATLQRVDRIVVHTDGLTENFDARGEMLGVDGLKEIVTDTSALPLAEMTSPSYWSKSRDVNEGWEQ